MKAIRPRTLSPEFLNKTAKPVYYRRAIESLHRAMAFQYGGSPQSILADGFSFAQAYFGRRQLSSALAVAVAGGTYQFAPAVLKSIYIDGKQRVIYSFTLLDRIVQKAVYRILAEAIQPRVSKQVYSYMPGRGRAQAVQDFTHFLKAHRRFHDDPRRRGLYVLRCDIKSYGESIPVAPHSSLWKELAHHFGRNFSEAEYLLLSQLIRPTIRHTDGSEYCPVIGIPDGAPISALLLNCYMQPLDHALASIGGGFYARYGDDMLFAHPERDGILRAEAAFASALEQLQLKRNDSKYRCFFYNGAARPIDSLPGSQMVDFLGLQIDFSGAVSLKQDKLRMLRDNLAMRARATVRATYAAPLEERGRILCHMLNEALSPESSSAHPYAMFLRQAVNDRAQLHQLDYWLARLVLRMLAGDGSVKQFRRIPYRHMRKHWQLRSLVYARN